MKKQRKRQAESYQQGYLFPFACFECRKSFKRAYKAGETTRKCPHCGGMAIMLDRKFKAPRADDLKQWEKIRRLVAAGFSFQSIHSKYPEKLREVDGFLAEHKRRMADSKGVPPGGRK